MSEVLERVVERLEERPSIIQIVHYSHEYLDGTLEVARQIHAHSIYANMPLDEAKLIRQLAAASWGQVTDRYFKLAVRSGEVLGGFYGTTLKVFFCDELTAKDMGWWVKESARGGKAAILLLADFERWAKARGARKCMVGQSGVENIDRTRRLFEHCGYALTGFNTSKEL